MDKERIALVVQRYGLDITGGAETHCRLLAEKLTKYYEVEILTSCVLDPVHWCNYYPEGWTVINGLRVCRFPVHRPRNENECSKLGAYIDGSPHTLEDEVRGVLALGPYVPDLNDYLHAHYANYKAIIFFTYPLYTGSLCMLGVPNAIMVPTAHDEPLLRLPLYQRTFAAPSAFLLNTEEERRLLEERFPAVRRKHILVGAYALDIESELYALQAKEIEHTGTPYIVYAGRICTGKGCNELVEFFCRYKDERKNQLHLVLIGHLDGMTLPDRPDIDYRGFVSEEEKICLMRGAKFLVLASRFESLSIVVLESLAVNTPVLVTGHSEVLQGHIDRSHCGYAYRDYEEFASALDNALADVPEYKGMCVGGHEYVQDNYSWTKVVDNVRKLVKKIGFQPQPQPHEPEPVCASTYFRRQLLPVYENATAFAIPGTAEEATLLAVTLRSLLSSARADSMSDIVIVSDGVSHEDKARLLHMADGYENISLRFYEVGERLDISLSEPQLITPPRDVALRVLLPEIFASYQRVVLLEAGTIVCHDLTELGKVDFQGNMVGAVRDYLKVEEAKSSPDLTYWIRHGLCLPRVEDYAKDSVLLLNIPAMCEAGGTSELQALASAREWHGRFQGILNHFAAGQILLLDPKWALYEEQCCEFQHLLRQYPEYMSARNSPYILTRTSCKGGRYEKNFRDMIRQMPY